MSPSCPHLEGGVLPDTEGMRYILGDGLLAEHVLRALHHRRLAHALHGVRAARGLLCARAASDWQRMCRCAGRFQAGQKLVFPADVKMSKLDTG